MRFDEFLQTRSLYLENLIHTKEKAIRKAPEGSVRITKNHHSLQFYFREDGSVGNGIYMRKSQRRKAISLAQKEYDLRIVNAARKELSKLNLYQKHYPECICEDVYQSMPDSFQQVVHPINDNPYELLKDWYQQDYLKNSFHEDIPDFYSSLGEQMRSKTEVLIANMLTQYHIPYLYEKQLNCPGYRPVYPDFTLFDLKNKREIYWEHFGMMDNLNYCRHMIQKYTQYVNAGLDLGKQLLLSFESSDMSLNMSAVEKMIRRLKEESGLSLLTDHELDEILYTKSERVNKNTGSPTTSGVIHIR